MPIGFPPTPTLNQEWPVVSPIWRYDGAKWNAIAGTGIAGATPITDRLISLVATDDFIALRADVPYLVAASVVEAGPVAATAPAAFTVGQWTAAATAVPGEISFNLSPLPSDGGSPVTALEYRVGTGAAIAFAGTGPGVRVVTAGLTAGVAVDLQVRAVNAVNPGAWSDVKNRTPLAGGGGGTVAWSAAGTVYEGFNTTHTVPVVAGGAVGEMLLVLLQGAATVSSITTNTGQTLALLATHSNGGITGRLYGVVISGSVPTSISVVLGALDDLQAQTFFAEGVTAAGGIQTNGSSISAIASYPYTSTVAESLVFAFLAHPSALNVATATFNGADAAFSITKWTNPNYISTFTGKHAGTVGAQTVPVTWAGGASTDGRWMTVELVP